MHLLSDAVFASVHPPESNQPLGPGTPPVGGCPSATPASSWRHSGWKDNRDRVWRALYRTRQPLHRIEAFESCGDRPYVMQHRADSERYTIVGSGCHDRFCLPCAQHRSRTIARRIVAKTENTEVRFLTLTLRTAGEPLADSLDRLFTSFAKLRRSGEWRARVSGGVAFLEVKWFEDTQRWHPHLHCLLQGRFFPHAALKSLWYSITGDSDIVDIRPARNQRRVSQYVTKYASKPFNDSFLHEQDRLDEAIVAMKGRRLATTFAAWRGYRLTELPSESDWLVLGTLDAIVFRASDGDHAAKRALAALPPDLLDRLLPEDRAPPPPPVVVRKAPSPQATLFSLAWYA